MKKAFFIPALSVAVCSPLANAREIVVLPGVVSPVGVVSGVDTRGPGTLTVGSQNINTSNDVGGAIVTDVANTANVVFTSTSNVTGFVGRTGTTFLNISAGTNSNTVSFGGPVFSTTFSVAGTGTVNFNGGFTSNSGSTMDFAGDGFINVGAGQTVKAAITNSAGARTGVLTLNNNSILDGAVGAASGLKQINVMGGNALITGQVNAGIYNLGTNTLNVAGAFAIPVAGTINTTIFSASNYGKIVPVGAATIGNALQVNIVITGPIANGTSFNIVDATSGTNGSTVIATDNSTRYRFSASPTANGRVIITTIQIPLVEVVAPIVTPVVPLVNPVVPVVIAPVIDALPVTTITAPLLVAITLLPEATAVVSALGQLAPGTTNLAAPRVAFRATQRFQDALAAHLACGNLSQPNDPDDVQSENAAPCQGDDRRPRFWGTALGYFGEQENVRGFEGYNSDILGAMLAYDTPVGDSGRVGLGVRYARSSLEGLVSSSETDINSYQAMGYLAYAPGAFFTNATFVYGWDRYSALRHVAFPGVTENAQADFKGHQYTAHGSMGYNFTFANDRTVITPLATLQYTRINTKGYAETGGNAINLRVDSQSYDFAQTGLGAKIAHNFSLSQGEVMRPEIHGNWRRSLGGETMSNTAGFVSGGPSFYTAGLEPRRNTYTVGAGVVFAKSGIWSVGGDYDYEWRKDSYKAQQAMIKFVVRL